ncbi:MAG: bifunctional precorrin-2 dehydrogenase/sirohydrochlorin ferrochelatase [Acidobacteria bacterium]|nr:bifunctional precorrin-2 dehydrogenase/sirohydrochlorin ferrochelatase [Acidobacteriota bacterium]
MDLFPMFLKLEGRRCLLVGAGAVAEVKLGSLLAAGADVLVVAPRATDQIRAALLEGKFRWKQRPFAPSDLDGMFLVVAAADSPQVHEVVYYEAQKRGVLCNVVDEPGRCDFYYPAVVRRGPLQIAISTSGRSPALAQRLRQQLERQFGLEFEDWVERLGAVRDRLLARKMDPARRRRILVWMARREPWKKPA